MGDRSPKSQVSFSMPIAKYEEVKSVAGSTEGRASSDTSPDEQNKPTDEVMEKPQVDEIIGTRDSTTLPNERAQTSAVEVGGASTPNCVGGSPFSQGGLTLSHIPSRVGFDSQQTVASVVPGMQPININVGFPYGRNSKRKKRRKGKKGKRGKRKEDYFSDSSSSAESSTSSDPDSMPNQSPHAEPDSSRNFEHRKSKLEHRISSKGLARGTVAGVSSFRQRRMNQDELLAEQHAILKIQTASRGYLCRKHANMELKHDQELACEAVLEELIDDYLRGEFIPDLFISIFTNSTNEYNPVSVEEQRAYEYYESIMREVVHTEISSIVRLTVREFMDDFLEFQTNKRENNPVFATMQHLVDDHVVRTTKEIVAEALQEMVNNYLFTQQFETFLHSLMEPFVKGVAIDSIYEMGIESERDKIISSGIASFIEKVVQESIVETEEFMQAQRKREEYNLISVLADKVLERQIFSQLLTTVASNGENVLFREQVGHLMHKHIATALLQNIETVFKPELALVENRAMRFAYQSITASALSEIMGSMFLQQLDLYEQEIDRNES